MGGGTRREASGPMRGAGTGETSATTVFVCALCLARWHFGSLASTMSDGMVMNALAKAGELQIKHGEVLWSLSGLCGWCMLVVHGSVLRISSHSQSCGDLRPLNGLWHWPCYGSQGYRQMQLHNPEPQSVSQLV